jgi:hypothetical protein
MLQQIDNEDDDDIDYYISDGGNYNYLYCSPYDSLKDTNHMINKIVSIDIYRNNYQLMR